MWRPLSCALALGLAVGCGSTETSSSTGSTGSGGSAGPGGGGAATTSSSAGAGGGGAGAGAGGGSTIDPRGIYVTWKSGATRKAEDASAEPTKAETDALAVDGIDGALVQMGWNALETADGHYDWSKLDARLDKVQAAGKLVELAITAGADSPDWLFSGTSPIAAPLDFTIAAHQGASGHCSNIVMAAPWDGGFLGRWTDFIHALGAHVAKYGTLVQIVKFDGINRSTEELRLPAETSAQLSSPSCTSPLDSPTVWKNAGYKPGRVVTAFEAMVEATVAAFPNAYYSATIISSNNAFPPFDADGNLVTSGAADEVDVTDAILKIAAAKAPPSRIVIQSDFLMTGVAPAQRTLKEAMDNGTLVAFQTNDYTSYGSHGDGAACGGTSTDPVACHEDTYLEELDEGVFPAGKSDPLRSFFIEIHTGEQIFPMAIATAHTALRE